MELTNENIWEIYAPLFEKYTPKMSKKLLLDGANSCFGKVLDIGCGSGKLWEYIDEKKVNNVLAIEKNRVMVNLASNKIDKFKFPITIFNEDLLNFNTKEKYDCAVSINVLYTQPSLEQHLSLVYNLLNTRGSFILSSPNISVNMGELEKLVNQEFSGEDYELFKRCNYFLSKGFNPKLYSSDEVVIVLEKLGFKIEKVNNIHYNNQNFFIVAKK